MILRLERVWRAIRRLFSRSQWLVRLLDLPIDIDADDANRAASGYRRGLVMVQIDGLGQKEMNRALQRGEMPFLRRLLEREHYRCHCLYSGLPSSTPAVQAELFYGVRTAVPAFAFRHRATGRLDRMFDPDSAARLERQLMQNSQGLLQGGSAWCDIYSGGASESHFCVATLGGGRARHTRRWHNWLGIGLLHLPTLLRTLALLALELVLALVDAVRGLFGGQRFLPEFKFISSRVAITILLRDLITLGARADIARGLPIIHLNYIGYDEQAHRRGPDSAFAHWTLRGIDRAVASLWDTAHHAPHRHYDVWVYADHGQERTVPFERHTGRPIHAAVQRAFNALEQEAGASTLQTDDHSGRHEHTRLMGKGWVQALLPSSGIARIEFAPRSPAVVAMGPVGHIYLANGNGAAERAQLAKRLVCHEQVPAALYRNARNQWCAQTASSVLPLPEAASGLLGEAHPFAASALQDLIALCEHEDAGDLVILGWSVHGPALSFPDENGSHAGPGPFETTAFALLPEDTPLGNADVDFLRPNDLRSAALHLLGRDELTRARPSALPARSPDCLRVMTYNVHSCIGMDSKISPERIARAIARYEPDIIALQELDVRRARTDGIDQAEQIARLLKMQYHFHPTMHIEGEQYGDAILTHLPVTLRRADALPGHPNRTGIEPRGALWVTVRFKDVKVQIVNTHLGLFSVERAAQVTELLGERWLGHPDCADPVILCGDLNALPNSDVLHALSTRLSDVQTRNPHFRPLNTFAGRMPTVRIDHILTAGFQAVDRVRVPNNDLTRQASDHLPLFADLRL